ncbi:MAG: stage III sporulation protein AC [Acutalibacteraceae bacterium]
MEVGIIIKIAMVGIIVAVLSQVLSRAGRDDYALITVLAGIAAVLIMLIPYFKELLDAINGILGD